MDLQLQQEIEKLIALKQEGEYWDFKKQWYDEHEKTHMLHDIICMANNLVNRDAYIIIGIDEEQANSVNDVATDPNRRSTQNMVDFLKDKKFAGGIRPRVVVESIQIQKKTVDILIIRNSNYTPFFLTERFGGVRENSIYTRVMDTNTPIDKTADINNIEYLWKKRFGLSSPVISRLHAVLDDINGWNIDWGNKKRAFNMYSPEFQLVCDEEYDERWLPQAAFYLNPYCAVAKLSITYFTTVIYETEIWAFDEFRIFLPKAENCYVEEIGNVWYSYYDLSSIEGKLLTVFTRGTNSVFTRGIPSYPFLIFNNEDDRQSFHSYFVKNYKKYSDEYIRNKYRYQIQKDEDKVGPAGFSAFQVGKAATLYLDWQKESNS